LPPADPNQPKTESVSISTRTGEDYRIRIGPSALEGLADVLSGLGTELRVALIGDSEVLRLHRDRIERSIPEDAVFIETHASEQEKTRAGKERIEDELLARRFGRDSVLIGCGGGITTDLAGFVAATFLRGIPFVALPTTLLAAVDASVGGKTGVNTPLGKNLIGVFRQPAAVLVDTDFLGTLPEAEFRNGLAESVKMAATSDGAQFENLERVGVRELRSDPRYLLPLIRRSIAIKARVVMEDEQETGPREVLNFGHTVGHAIENATGYRMRHGFAVAPGMAAESHMAERAGFLGSADGERLRGLLVRHGLPVRLEKPLSRERVLAAFRADKKTRAGQTRFVVLTGIGRVRREGTRCSFSYGDEVIAHGLARIGLTG